MEIKKSKILISAHVANYLEKVDTDVGFQIDFDWDGEAYSTETDVIFVIKQ